MHTTLPTSNPLCLTFEMIDSYSNREILLLEERERNKTQAKNMEKQKEHIQC